MSDSQKRTPRVKGRQCFSSRYTHKLSVWSDRFHRCWHHFGNVEAAFVDLIHDKYQEFPPFTGKHWPVMKLDQSESRKMMASATSVAYAILPLGIIETWALPTATLGSSFGAPATIASASGVSVAPDYVNSRSYRRLNFKHLPGATKFTRILGKSRAHDLVSPRTACFEAVYAAIPGTPRRDAPLPTLTMDP